MAVSRVPAPFPPSASPSRFTLDLAFSTPDTFASNNLQQPEAGTSHSGRRGHTGLELPIVHPSNHLRLASYSPPQSSHRTKSCICAVQSKYFIAAPLVSQMGVAAPMAEWRVPGSIRGILPFISPCRFTLDVVVLIKGPEWLVLDNNRICSSWHCIHSPLR